jgi:hypothetical protein
MIDADVCGHANYYYKRIADCTRYGPLQSALFRYTYCRCRARRIGFRILHSDMKGGEHTHVAFL